MAAWLCALLLLAPPQALDGVDVAGWSTRQLWELSDKYFHAGKYPEAIRVQERIRRLDPHDLDAYTVAAWLVWSGGDEAAARRLLLACVHANPKSWEPYHELGFHLFDRVGDVAGAIPYLQQAVGHPPYPDTAERTLAHAYLANEQPNLALVVWDRLRQGGRTPGAVLEINSRKAVAMALRSDLRARLADTIYGPVDPQQVPRVVADRRTGGQPGHPDHRELDLARPGSAAGTADFRISYQGRWLGQKVTWSWTSMLAAKKADGTFDEQQAVRDTDGDGIAESIPSLAELRRQRLRPPAVRRFVCPDRYELGVDAAGRSVPFAVTVAPGKLTWQMPFVIASDERSTGVHFRLVNSAQRTEAAQVWAEVPPGVYCGNVAGGPAIPLGIDTAPAGRYVMIAELWVRGVVVDRKLDERRVAVRDAAGWHEAAAEAWEIRGWQLPAPGAMPDAAEAPAEPVRH